MRQGDQIFDCVHHCWENDFCEPTIPTVEFISMHELDDPAPADLTYIQHQRCRLCGVAREIHKPSGNIRKEKGADEFI